MKRLGLLAGVMFLMSGFWASAEVTVSNLVVAQRPGTKLVDINYDVASTVTNRVKVSLVVSNGASVVACPSVTGDVGVGVATGAARSMVWDGGADWSGNVAAGVVFAVTGDDWVVPGGMVLVTGGTTAGITVSSFYIGKCEVTWGEWQTVRTWAAANGYDIGSIGSGSGTNHPVIYVSWYDVVKWCNARSEMEGRTPVYTVGGAVYRSGQNKDVAVSAAATGYRLPTAAEWEYAARGGTQSQGYEYSGGNDVNAVAWYNENAGGGTHVVGTKAASELGLYDMSGNVWEFCFDWFVLNWYRVIRGGSWIGRASLCRSVTRTGYAPDSRSGDYGFRLARTLP